jgi:hypothetical protein
MIDASALSPTYALHGLRVRSEVRLDAPLISSSSYDVEIRWADRRAIPDAPPDGEVLSILNPSIGSSWLTRNADGYVWRVHGACEFVTDPTRTHVQVHLAPDADEEIASLLAVTFLARMLVLDGSTVLHASAVELDGRAVALIGHTGAGKTTLAALCCMAGARLVTDDALRVELAADGPLCYRGSNELRLRPQAERFAELFAPGARRTTLDQRTAVRPELSPGVTFPLAAIVAPRCLHAQIDVQVERVHGAAAVLELLRYPRTLGWTDPQQPQRNLDLLSALAAAVPVYRAELPWTDELGPQVAEELLAAVLPADRGVSDAPRRS